MKVIFVPESNVVIPASRYRVYFLITELKKRGVDGILVTPPPATYRYLMWFLRSFWYTINFILKIIRHHDAEAVFIHRGLWYRGQGLAVRFAKLFGMRIVFDFDDAVFIQKPKAFRSMMAMADVVIVGNDYLAEEARRYTRGHIHIIPTLIPSRLVAGYHRRSATPSKRVVLVWIGLPGNFKYLSVIRSSLSILATHHPLELKIISRFDGPDRVEDFCPPNLIIRKVPWSEQTEWLELTEGDIGLMPLSEGSWERGKCGFKIIQYMALGIAPIASAVGENSKIIRDGVSGFLAKNQEEWGEKLERLITDVELRKKMGEASHRIFQERYVLDAFIPQYLSILGCIEGKK